jgi:hypothetical protein
LTVTQTSGAFPSLKRLEPDAALGPALDVANPRVVVELEVCNRSPSVLAKHCLELLDRSQLLRVVVGVKVYPRSDSNPTHGPFAAVCFVYRKDALDRIHLERVFDVGTRPQNLQKELVAEEWCKYVALPGARLLVLDPPVSIDPAATTPTPVDRDTTTFVIEPLPPGESIPADWEPSSMSPELRSHCSVTILEEDVFYGCDVQRPDGAEPRNLELDISAALAALDEIKTKTFTVP